MRLKRKVVCDLSKFRSRWAVVPCNELEKSFSILVTARVFFELISQKNSKGLELLRRHNITIPKDDKSSSFVYSIELSQVFVSNSA